MAETSVRTNGRESTDGHRGEEKEREREAKYEAIPSLSRSDIGIRKHGAHGVAGTGIRG